MDDASVEQQLGADEVRPAAGPRRAAFEREHHPSRVLALSDGVFAIVMTLMVLEVHLPDLSSGLSLTDALKEIRPSFTAFVISFILTGMYWVGHRDLFSMIRRTDRFLVWLSVLYLLPPCMLPFAASLLGRYEVEPVALRIYGLVLLAIALMRVCIWVYAARRPRLLWQPLDQAQRRAGLAVTLTPGLVVLVAIAIAAIAPRVSLLIYAAIPVMYFLSITVLRSDRRRDQEFADFT